MQERVQKILSNSGFCSRRKAEELIKAGKVKVNGKIAALGDRASSEDKIYVDGELVKKEKKVYLMFNKPVGCVCAREDKFLKTIMEYIHVKERVFPVGRLDFNTSGLLLLTNDGDFANKVMHPRYEIKKTYRVVLDKAAANQDIFYIEHGVRLEDGKTSPAKVNKIKENIIEIAIHEGKKRVIRRMFKQLGYSVVRLERIRIGKLELGDLAEGKYRELSEKEIELIFRK
jgi:23S rRNA pseudouridine2605 synthase